MGGKKKQNECRGSLNSGTVLPLHFAVQLGEKMGGGGLSGLFGERSNVCGWMRYMHASLRKEERCRENLLCFLTMRIVYFFFPTDG